MSIHIRTFPRAGLIGNPSDGFFGRTIAFTFDDFYVDLNLEKCDRLELHQIGVPCLAFESVTALIESVSRQGYDSDHGLLCATIKRFHQHIGMDESLLAMPPFSLSFRSTIPFQLGFAGSSAIIIAGLRALASYYDLTIPPHEMAALALDVETRELNIAGGLQDRVAQVYQGLIYMDFDRDLMENRGFGDYEKLDPSGLPHLFIAYRHSFAEESGIYGDRQ